MHQKKFPFLLKSSLCAGNLVVTFPVHLSVPIPQVVNTICTYINDISWMRSTCSHLQNSPLVLRNKYEERDIFLTTESHIA